MLKYVDKLLQGDRRSAAKLITLIENDGPAKQEVMSRIYPHTGRAYVIGLTGSPGAGKSSLVDEIIKQIRAENLKVGIIAVDPTSPFSGGALLGDRIRMQEHALDRGVFIRSMGTRGSLGGLARATKDVVKVLDAYGCDIIIIETVGVGQSELDIMHYADTTIVVLTPGAGDHVQTIKAGIMEIADVFVINKADLGSTGKMIVDIEGMLDLSPLIKGWRPPVLPTSTLDGKNIPQLWEAIKNHRQYSVNTGSYRESKEQRLRLEVLEIIQQELMRVVHRTVLSNGQLDNLTEKLINRQIDPYAAAGDLINNFFTMKGERPDV